MKHTLFEAFFSRQSKSRGCPYTLDKIMMAIPAVKMEPCSPLLKIEKRRKSQCAGAVISRPGNRTVEL